MARGSAALTVSGDTMRSTVVPDGDGARTAFNVAVTDPEHLAGVVEPGSWIAVFVSEDPEPFLADESARKLPPLTRILLPKVEVLEVQVPGVASPAGPATTGRTILTIAVTQAEAEKVVCSSRNGDLTFALRSDRTLSSSRSGSTGRMIAPALYGSAS